MSAVAERVGNRIYVRAPFDPEKSVRFRAMQGNWAANAKAWSLPMSMAVCKELRKMYGKNLEIGPALWRWAKNKNQIATSIDELLASQENLANTFERTRVYARIREHSQQLASGVRGRPYQIGGVGMASIARRILLADQPGVGKTIQCLGALVAEELQGRVLVIAPVTSTSATWEPEIHKWIGDYTHGVHVTNLAGLSIAKRDDAIAKFHGESESLPGLHFLLVNPEMTRIKIIRENDKEIAREVMNPFLFDEPWDAIIADETHKFLINVSGKRASQVGVGMCSLEVKNDQCIKIALSGTPLKGKTENLWGTLHWLNPDEYSSKWNWIMRYFETEEDQYSTKIGALRQDRIDEYFEELKHVMLRRTKQEIRDMNPNWMPPKKEYHDIWVPVDGPQMTAYKKMEKSATVELQGGTLTAIGVLAEFTRLKQFAGCHGKIDAEKGFVPTMPSNKFDWLVQFLEDRGITKEPSVEVQKVVVASQFTSFINLWSAELTKMGIPHYTLTGHTKMSERDKIVKAFQSNDTHRVIFINTNAGGASITLDRADDVVLMDETWVPDEQEQVEDRVHRASNVAHQVDVWYVRSSGTIEESIAETGLEKGLANHQTLDSQRGLEFARSINWEQPRKEAS